MYFKWTVHDEYPDSLWLEYDHEGCIDPGVFRVGKKLRKAPGPLSFRLSGRPAAAKLKKLDYLMSDATELVSERLMDLIERVAPGDCQFFAATVATGGSKLDGYFVVNVVHRSACIDMKKSRYKPMVRGEPGPPFDFTKYVMVADSLGSRHVVRADQDDEMVVVTRAFVDACRGGDMRGCGFEALG